MQAILQQTDRAQVALISFSLLFMPLFCFRAKFLKVGLCTVSIVISPVLSRTQVNQIHYMYKELLQSHRQPPHCAVGSSPILLNLLLAIEKGALSPFILKPIFLLFLETLW